MSESSITIVLYYNAVSLVNILYLRIRTEPKIKNLIK